MRDSLIILILLLLNRINAQQMELVAGHVLFRHGDRTPLSTYPTDPMKEKDWPNGYGQLTTMGAEQHYRLGQYIRHRYVSILSSSYINTEILIRSTNFTRTIKSAQSNLMGLYALLNTSNDKIPDLFIPIHTVPLKQDFLLGTNHCPRYEQLKNEVHQSDDFKKIDKYYEPFFEKLQRWTNIPKIALLNVWSLLDTLYIEHIYNKAPAWADENVRKTLSDINNAIFYFHYLNNDTRRIRGGPVIQDIWSNMNNSYHGQVYHKVKMYSAHDDTVSAVLAFLRIDYAQQPEYASAVFIDLYKQNSKYFVQVEYLNVTDSNISYPHILNGCSAVKCPLEIFTSIYQPLFPGNADIECAGTTAPSSGNNGSNTKLIVILILLVVAVGIIIAAIFACTYRKKTEQEQPLLANQPPF